MRLFTLEGKEKISCEIINNPPAMVAQVILKPGRDKNIRMRHPWVFSGAVERVTGAPQAGETVEVRSVHNDLLGMGAWSPQSQIQVRLWTVGRALIDADFFGRQLAAAIGRRTTLGLETGNSALRLVNAESDGLPGVVLDRYGDWLVLQCLTTGAEYWKATLVAWLSTQLPCRGIYERSDAEVRRKEGLEPVCGLLWGEMPPASVDIVEQGRQYRVDVLQGHKTGFYLDQRDNRSLVQQHAAGCEVLNGFAYTGGFGIAALKGGAAHVTHIDTSGPALALAAQAEALNGFASGCTEHVQDDVFQRLRHYREAGRRFDLIVLDPPKFAENRSQLDKAARGYKDINLLGFRLLRPGGLLFTFSCSGLMDAALFQKIVADAAVDAGCGAGIIRKLDQAADHPTALAFPEGYYLKGLLCQRW